VMTEPSVLSVGAVHDARMTADSPPRGSLTANVDRDSPVGAVGIVVSGRESARSMTGLPAAEVSDLGRSPTVISPPPDSHTTHGVRSIHAPAFVRNATVWSSVTGHVAPEIRTTSGWISSPRKSIDRDASWMPLAGSYT
jgi:hypothetical protein